MLRYFGEGTRYYNRWPVQVKNRPNWEFQAVVEGVVAPEIKDVATLTPSTNRLWVFSPQCCHGWTSTTDSPCKVLVFHFPLVPAPLSSIINHQTQNFLWVDFTDEERRNLLRLGDMARQAYHQPTSLSTVYFDLILAELTILLLQNCQEMRQPLTVGYARKVVDMSMAWYMQHLSDNPDVATMAKAVHVSPSHLRRLFRQADAGNPLGMMRDMQIRRACELMRTTNMSLKHVADACGFSGPTVFSRAFRHYTGVTPQYWRRRPWNRNDAAPEDDKTDQISEPGAAQGNDDLES